jgi:hypothetical protein
MIILVFGIKDNFSFLKKNLNSKLSLVSTRRYVRVGVCVDPTEMARENM